MKVQTKLFNNLVKTLLNFKTHQDMKEFMCGILTPKELDEIPTRLEIVKRLKMGQPHHLIAKQLGVGVATVTRGSKELQRGRFKNV